MKKKELEKILNSEEILVATPTSMIIKGTSSDILSLLATIVHCLKEKTDINDDMIKTAFELGVASNKELKEKNVKDAR